MRSPPGSEPVATARLFDHVTKGARAVAAHFVRRREWYLVPLFFGLVVAITFREILAGEKGVGWDLIESYWPDLGFFAHELRRGNFPLWNPFERGGVPSHADPQPAIFYPVQWLLGIWAVLRGETSWNLIQFKELFHHALAASLLYLYVRSRRMPWQAGLVAGLAVLVSDIFMIGASNNFLQSLAYVPLVWMATDAFMEKPGARSAVALAASLYLPASVGSPPGYWYTLLATGAYGLFRAGVAVSDWVWARARGETSWRQALTAAAKSCGFLGLAVVLVAATQAILFLPTRDLLALSPRAERTVDFAIQIQAGYLQVLPGLLAPLKTIYTGHCGVLPPVLALVVLALSPLRDRGAPIMFALVGIFFLFCSFGPDTPVLRYLVVHVPGFGLFRVSLRYLAPFPFFFGALAAHGMTVLLDPRTRLWGRRIGVVAIALVVVVLTRYAVNHEPLLVLDPAHPRLPVIVGGALAFLLVAVVVLPHRAAPGMVLAAILVFFGFGEEVVRRELGFQPRPDNLEDANKVSGLRDLNHYRVYDEFLLEQRAGSRLGLREFRGYTSEDPLSRTDYLQILNSATTGSNMPLLGEFNIRYIFYGQHTTKGWSRRRLQGAPDTVAPKRYVKKANAIYEDRYPAPQFAWYGGIKRVPEPEILNSLRMARDDAGVRRVAILPKAGIPPETAAEVAKLVKAAANAPPGVAGEVKRFDTERIDATIDAPADGVVVLNEFMFPGWEVFVDGARAVPLTIDYCLRGVLVSKGHHEVKWVYRPLHWRWLMGGWLVGLAVFAAALFANRLPSASRRVRALFPAHARWG